MLETLLTIREMIRDEGNGEERGKIRMEGGKIVFS